MIRSAAIWIAEPVGTSHFQGIHQWITIGITEASGDCLTVMVKKSSRATALNLKTCHQIMKHNY